MADAADRLSSAKPDPQSRYFYVYDPDGLSVQLKQKSDK